MNLKVIVELVRMILSGFLQQVCLVLDQKLVFSLVDQPHLLTTPLHATTEDHLDILTIVSSPMILALTELHRGIQQQIL